MDDGGKFYVRGPTEESVRGDFMEPERLHQIDPITYFEAKLLSRRQYHELGIPFTPSSMFSVFPDKFVKEITKC